MTLVLSMADLFRQSLPEFTKQNNYFDFAMCSLNSNISIDDSDNLQNKLQVQISKGIAQTGIQDIPTGSLEDIVKTSPGTTS